MTLNPSMFSTELTKKAIFLTVILFLYLKRQNTIKELQIQKEYQNLYMSQTDVRVMLEEAKNEEKSKMSSR